MDAKQFLESRELPDYFKKIIAELEEVHASGTTHRLLTKDMAALGLLLLLESPEEKNEPNFGYRRPVTYKNTRYDRIAALLPAQQWNDPAAWNLLVYLFGEEKAAYVKYAWERIPYQMYQVNTDRRSFTAPHDPEVYFVNQLNFLIYAVPQTFQVVYVPKTQTICYDLSITEQIRYDQALNSHYLYRIWAAAIDLGNEAVFQLMEDIIFNKDTIGKVTRPIIKALLNSEKQQAWELVEKLLLAAQRQEGLRQTILESLDETSTGALKYMIKVLIDHKMTRFSSVVRAVDVWAGLGWDAEKESTVKKFLEKAHEYLETPALIPAALQSQHNMEVYMALWAQGVYDVAVTKPLLEELFTTGNTQKRCLALKFARETKYYNIDMPLLYRALKDKEEVVLGAAVTGINQLLHGRRDHYNQYFPELFSRLHAIAERSSGKEKVFTSQVFSWMNITFDRNDVWQAMLHLIGDQQDRLDIMMGYYDEMNLSLREQLARQIFPEHAAWGWNEQTSKVAALTAFQRNFAIRLLKDRGEFVVDVAFRALSKEQFAVTEMPVFVELLKRKSAGGRSKAIALILRQQEDVVAAVTTQLLEGDAEQRLAGLDIAVQLKKGNRLVKEINDWQASFKERKNISQREEMLLLQLSADNEQGNYTGENGYGLFDRALISPVVAPVADADDYYAQCLQTGEYGFSMPVTQMQEALKALYTLILENGDHEYEAESYDGSRRKVLIANEFSANKPYSYTFESPEAEYAAYPLPEVWEQWYQEHHIQPRDIFILNTLLLDKQEQGETWQQLTAAYYPAFELLIPEACRTKHTYRWSNPLMRVLTALQLIHPFAERNAFLLGATRRLFASFTPEVLSYQSDGKQYPYTRGGWQKVGVLNKLPDLVNTGKLAGDEIAQAWQLYHWRQFTGIEVIEELPPLTLFCSAYEAGLISESEMYRGLISKDNLRLLSQTRQRKDAFDYFGQFPFLKEMFIRVREHFLDIELKRGDTATAVTKFVPQLETVYGINRLAEILTGLGKTTLYRGYIYGGSDDFTRQQQFSTLLKKCFPAPEDTQELFDKTLQSLKISEAQLIEAAVYAPQWQQFVSKYLNWKGLDAAIWWMHAHTKSSGAAEQNAEAESEIARYSAVDLADFKIGAVDKDWFLKAYKEIGKARWQIVYDAAKYISDGNEHRRARLYADVITGDIKLKEITQKIKEKRDQDYLRMYGLVPLSKANPDKDVLGRYEYLQQFKKESRQFGAQKQTSEALAIRIALENLARNAGYADPLRLTWAMETRQVQQILSKETQVQYDDVSIGLVIDATGMADVVAFKGDKPLKAIPPKYKKDAKVEELNDYRKILREQFSRSKKSLEDAMVRGDSFLYTELANLFGHPVIARHLEKLVFVAGEKHGFYHDGTLHAPGDREFVLNADDQIFVAHSSDLYRLKVWSDYQRYAFEKQLQQPFKQIFRELYVPLADELAEKSISRRYAGHQVQPSQTVALLKNRHWKVDYEEGLQKVFHKEGFVAKIYAMANWFSPADVESPTLETVIFHDLKTHKPVAFEQISPLIFSEVMRDIDLVVSVAHVGGVDPEASHSSIEMRRVLLTETLRLFKIDNVTVSGHHARIKGQHGEYSVHLGSAVAHQLPGKYLSVLPVHSQHRGRIFLPFIDDDPKSAELISKVLLLARDQEIQDPTILSQLSMN
ncbi:DUF4132 domain-containing protein [Chitinophaga arvensicola]|uniref:DUF4132 domain-containing protein n=1 Tax=Chitinophaga arvensicola TaxID=29529 RepID=A0A1I0S7Z4_9BACT|nr:DUF4132 domain-containing protein [Chitinophaga arvensicola]SEW51898.1 protein of unknown function [Chitinophaga arvensicola]